MVLYIRWLASDTSPGCSDFKLSLFILRIYENIINVYISISCFILGSFGAAMDSSNGGRDIESRLNRKLVIEII